MSEQQPAEPPRYVLDTATGKVAPLDDSARAEGSDLYAATLAVADASVEMVEALEKQVAIEEESPAAMVHHGERWLEELRAAHTRVVEACDKHRRLTHVLIEARKAKEGAEATELVPPATCPAGHALTWHTLKVASCSSKDPGAHIGLPRTMRFWWGLESDGTLAGPFGDRWGRERTKQ